MMIFLMAATVVAAIAALTDLRSGHIPNWLTVSGIFAGLVGHGIFGCYRGGWQLGLIELSYSAAGVLFCSIAPFVMWWKGGMGGGDLKLFAAIGALCQPLIGIEAEMYGFVVAALIAPAQLAYQGRLFSVLKNSFALLANPMRAKDAKRPVPPEMMTWFRLGPAIFAGMLIALMVHSYDF